MKGKAVSALHRSDTGDHFLRVQVISQGETGESMSALEEFEFDLMIQLPERATDIDGLVDRLVCLRFDRPTESFVARAGCGVNIRSLFMLDEHYIL
ncbi:hypothetical protein [Phaeovulum veldkampii]|uniref:hypothetical protein n=1 Tax=Phaeovulum veldkampii TaxID=33049 RepID=UPI00105CF9C3|nr:hypothetical protein [Phaeovulum veldkampii]